MRATSSLAKNLLRPATHMPPINTEDCSGIHGCCCRNDEQELTALCRLRSTRFSLFISRVNTDERNMASLSASNSTIHLHILPATEISSRLSDLHCKRILNFWMTASETN
ncbi:hypothetical protein AVEN_88123-1 [Araneus ventricosus]|uniref:Uncharacterized protein n=1 Tax=Araneus ventricosus TaxID=182803 RepID=A0A4Y2QAM8_ARAVE|nr:hypothetical protein AVEN_88123-1 [Araneus ventricosus]